MGSAAEGRAGAQILKVRFDFSGRFAENCRRALAGRPIETNWFGVLSAHGAGGHRCLALIQFEFRF